MARTPQPTAIHELKGSFDKNPQRRRKGEPKPKSGIGPAPSHLGEYEQRVWDELVGIALPGVLGDVDRWAVEMAVRLMAEMRASPETFTAGKYGHLISCLSRMGMTPSDRTKLAVQGKSDDEGWDDL